ncbi:MAG: hypothetical protein WD688_15940 [Candidatus Binatia bacterium]
MVRIASSLTALLFHILVTAGIPAATLGGGKARQKRGLLYTFRVELEITVRYGFDNEVVGTQYTVVIVKEVLPANPEHQYALVPDDKS